MNDRDKFGPRDDPDHPSHRSSMENDDSWLQLRLDSSDHRRNTLRSLSMEYRAFPRDLMSTDANIFENPNGSSSMGLNDGGCAVSYGGGMTICRQPRWPDVVGVWFTLQASQNNGVKSVLPQIPKSYLRIKNPRMTVRLLTKYLAHKLRLKSESEVEIKCRGKELQPILTIQYVRDNIWCRKDDTSLLTLLTNTYSKAETSLIMTLHYASKIPASSD